MRTRLRTLASPSHTGVCGAHAPAHAGLSSTHAQPRPRADIDDEARAAAASEAVARLWGDAAGYDTLLPESGFAAGALAVWETPAEDLTLASWRRVAELPLGGQR